MEKPALEERCEQPTTTTPTAQEGASASANLQNSGSVFSKFICLWYNSKADTLLDKWLLVN